jgi:hypothetical protein
MEIMIKVDFFHGEMCKKNLPKAKQEGPLRDRLLKKWIKRINATGAWSTIQVLEDAGETITGLHQIWTPRCRWLRAPPGRPARRAARAGARSDPYDLVSDGPRPRPQQRRGQRATDSRGARPAALCWCRVTQMHA